MEEEKLSLAAEVAARLEPAKAGERQRFAVDLRPGETTIVSWKRLLKDSGKGGGGSPPAIDPMIPGQVGLARPTAEGELQDVPSSSRFSAVIEKIECLYMGKQSSDEEDFDDIPDDDEYDTEDSFIDDTELDDYFQVDETTTKHNGFFVNKGKLERIEPSSSANLASSKRRKKNSTRGHSEKNGEHIPKEPVNMDNVRIKAAAQSIPMVGKQSCPGEVLTSLGHQYQQDRHLKYKSNIPTATNWKKSTDFAMNSENTSYLTMSYKDVSFFSSDTKDFDKQKAGMLLSRDFIYEAPMDKAIPSQLESQAKKLLKCETDVEASAKIRHKERNELPDLNSSASIYPLEAVQPPSMRTKDVAAVRPKGTTLERAIRDLERVVALCRPPDLDVPEIDASSQGIKRRLPQEVKQKLAKVARLSASQCKISEDDLVDRLMGILGHLVQQKTLKRNMREMVELGLSAKQQKAARFQQIKNEVNEMIRARVSFSKSKVPEQLVDLADDLNEAPFNDDKTASKRKFSMDKALEDRICDLYDLYVEGMDEDKGPQSRKLYVELLELWPSGYMDKLGIKEAIYRSKERKRVMYSRHKARDNERIKRKKMAAAMKPDERIPSVQLRAGQEKHAIDSSGQLNVSPSRPLSGNQTASPAPSATLADSSPPANDFVDYLGSKHHENFSSSSVNKVRKKMKRRPEPDSARDVRDQDHKEKHKNQKESEDSLSASSSIHKPGNPFLAPPGSGNQTN